jgi:hypothetical protein
MIQSWHVPIFMDSSRRTKHALQAGQLVTAKLKLCEPRQPREGAERAQRVLLQAERAQARRERREGCRACDAVRGEVEAGEAGAALRERRGGAEAAECEVQLPQLRACVSAGTCIASDWLSAVQRQRMHCDPGSVVKALPLADHACIKEAVAACGCAPYNGLQSHSAKRSGCCVRKRMCRTYVLVHSC